MKNYSRRILLFILRCSFLVSFSAKKGKTKQKKNGEEKEQLFFRASYISHIAEVYQYWYIDEKVNHATKVKVKVIYIYRLSVIFVV